MFLELSDLSAPESCLNLFGIWHPQLRTWSSSLLPGSSGDSSTEEDWGERGED